MKLVLLLLVVAPLRLALAAPPTSDAARLNQANGLEDGRVVVWLLPPVDHRPVLGATTESSRAFGDFLKSIKAWGNLDVRSPDRAVTAITSSPQHRQAIALARAAARRGVDDYRQVQLGVAAEGLSQAMEGFLALGHQWVAPQEVARTEQTHALALLELGNAVSAAAAFRRALLIDPAVRLRVGVDRAAAVEAQEQARAVLAEELPAAQALFAQRPPLPAGATLQVRLLPDRIEVVLHEGGRLVVEQQLIDVPDAGERLAARVWACLPFGEEPRRRSTTRHLRLDAGFSWFTFAKAPTDLFGNVGVGVNASLDLARFLTLEGGAGLTISARDRKEDLRADLPVGRFNLGPGLSGELGRVRGTAGVGLEVAVMGPVATTTNPACKYFKPGDVPPRICDFERDIDHRPTTWTVGPALSLGGSVRLMDGVFLGLRLQGALYIFRTEDNGLDRPVGAQVVLGYPVF